MATLSGADNFVVQQSDGPANALISDLEGYIASVSSGSLKLVTATAAGTDISTATALSSAASVVSVPSAGTGVVAAPLYDQLQIIYALNGNLNVYPPPVGQSDGQFSGYGWKQPYVLSGGSAMGILNSSDNGCFILFGRTP